MLRGRDPSAQSLVTWATWLAITLVASGIAQAEEADTPAPIGVAPLNHAVRAEIVDSVLTKVRDEYILPDVAIEMDEHVRARLAEGAYDDITSLSTFAEQLTTDLHHINPDRHLWISKMRPEDFYPSAGDTLTDADRAERARQNYGFRKVERMKGNVGYLELQMFDDATYGSDAAAAAMGFLARCDAVIIDIRNNGGGEESMVQLLCSYFMKEPTLLRDVRHRNQDSWQSWSFPTVPGEKLCGADVYLLVGYNTGSAAEAFSSAMKHLGGATLVGEKTRGAAYMCDFYDFPSLGVRAKVSTGMPIEPTTGSNWERVGVEPDIEVPVDEALKKAHQLALSKLAGGELTVGAQYEIDWVLAGYQAEQEPVSLDTAILRRYVGVYGETTISLTEGRLSYRLGDGPESRLVAMAETLLAFEGSDYKRLRFLVDEDGKALGLDILYDDGYVIERARSGD